MHSSSPPPFHCQAPPTCHPDRPKGVEGSRRGAVSPFPFRFSASGFRVASPHPPPRCVTPTDRREWRGLAVVPFRRSFRVPRSALIPRDLASNPFAVRRYCVTTSLRYSVTRLSLSPVSAFLCVLCPSTSLRAARAWSRGCVSAVNCRAVCRCLSPAPLRVAANHDDVRFCRFFPRSALPFPNSCRSLRPPRLCGELPCRLPFAVPQFLSFSASSASLR